MVDGVFRGAGFMGFDLVGDSKLPGQLHELFLASGGSDEAGIEMPLVLRQLFG